MWPLQALCKLFTSLRTPAKIKLRRSPCVCLVLVHARLDVKCELRLVARWPLFLPTTLDTLGFGNRWLCLKIRGVESLGLGLLFRNYHQGWRPMLLGRRALRTASGSSSAITIKDGVQCFLVGVPCELPRATAR